MRDRQGRPLTFSYHTHWNTSDTLPLHDAPELLQHAFVLSEDKRFFEHQGVDWIARANALWQRVRHGHFSRGGASTMTEQVVRMIHPRPRSFWSKWIEGLEALSLEMHVSKADILEFYLNQVPYAANRRGVVQAARYYFNRDADTLTTKEMLALAVLVRAPSKYDLYAGKVQIEAAIRRLADVMLANGKMDEATRHSLASYTLALEPSQLPVPAFHFVDYVRGYAASQPSSTSKTLTTLDGNLQQFVQGLLENRLDALASRNISHAAALVVDHTTHEILAWVSVGARCKDTHNQASGCKIDMVTVPRQPGSALKPFLYASALEKGWTPATIIDDAPFSDTVGKGIHHFHNYSNSYYGKVTLRTALGNSLNIPAVHTINYVTPERYLARLHALGFSTLRRGADFYDDGLALGNGEVSLFELVQAYAAFPNRGMFAPLRPTLYHDVPPDTRQVYSEQVASLIGHILSDPWARMLEFGRSSVLNLPTQTAAKTGTSTDYRDAWAIGYNHRYVVGIWMGNADYSPTDGITGSLGPALALRGIFNELNNNSETAPLYLSPKLVVREVCSNVEDILRHTPDCATRSEYFLADTEAEQKTAPVSTAPKITISRPANHLEMAVDPRIPSAKQAFEMRLSGAHENDEVEWTVGGKKYARTIGTRFLWPTEKGKHSVYATIWRSGEQLATTNTHHFQVK